MQIFKVIYDTDEGLGCDLFSDYESALDRLFQLARSSGYVGVRSEEDIGDWRSSDPTIEDAYFIERDNFMDTSTYGGRGRSGWSKSNLQSIINEINAPLLKPLREAGASLSEEGGLCNLKDSSGNFIPFPPGYVAGPNHRDMDGFALSVQGVDGWIQSRFTYSEVGRAIAFAESVSKEQVLKNSQSRDHCYDLIRRVFEATTPEGLVVTLDLERLYGEYHIAANVNLKDSGTGELQPVDVWGSYLEEVYSRVGDADVCRPTQLEALEFANSVLTSVLAINKNEISEIITSEL